LARRYRRAALCAAARAGQPRAHVGSASGRRRLVGAGEGSAFDRRDDPEAHDRQGLGAVQGDRIRSLAAGAKAARCRVNAAELRRCLSAFLVVIGLPLLVSACVFGRDGGVPWYEAVIQVYAARAVAWRGIFAVHTWIVVKPTDALRFTRYEVLGFGVSEGA